MQLPKRFYNDTLFNCLTRTQLLDSFNYYFDKEYYKIWLLIDRKNGKMVGHACMRRTIWDRQNVEICYEVFDEKLEGTTMENFICKTMENWNQKSNKINKLLIKIRNKDKEMKLLLNQLGFAKTSIFAYNEYWNWSR